MTTLKIDSISSLSLKDGHALVRRFKMEEITPGGIVMPDQVRAKHPPALAEVMLVGNECKYSVVGGIVIFNEFAGHEVTFQTDSVPETLLIIDEEEILAWMSLPPTETSPVADQTLITDPKEDL